MTRTMPNTLRYTRLGDGPAMWNTGPKRTPGPSAPSVPDARAVKSWWIGIDTHTLREIEILNMILKPHLFEDTERNLMLSASAYTVRTTLDHGYADDIVDCLLTWCQARARITGRLNADCDTCRCTVLVTSDTCPDCKGELS